MYRAAICAVNSRGLLKGTLCFSVYVSCVLTAKDKIGSPQRLGFPDDVRYILRNFKIVVTPLNWTKANSFLVA